MFRLHSVNIAFLLVSALWCQAYGGPVEPNFKDDIASDSIIELTDLNKEESLKAPATLAHRDRDLPRINLNYNDNYKYDVEILESHDLKKETEQLEERYRDPGSLHTFDTDTFVDENIEVHGGEAVTQHGSIVLTVILTTVGIVSIGLYVALVRWRVHLEERYGARTLLVDNDDDDVQRNHNGNSNNNRNNIDGKMIFNSHQGQTSTVIV